MDAVSNDEVQCVVGHRVQRPHGMLQPWLVWPRGAVPRDTGFPSQGPPTPQPAPDLFAAQTMLVSPPQTPRLAYRITHGPTAPSLVPTKLDHRPVWPRLRSARSSRATLRLADEPAPQPARWRSQDDLPSSSIDPRARASQGHANGKHRTGQGSRRWSPHDSRRCPRWPSRTLKGAEST